MISKRVEYYYIILFIYEFIMCEPAKCLEIQCSYSIIEVRRTNGYGGGKVGDEFL